MRRGIGAAAIVKRRERDSKLNELGESLQREREENAKEIIEKFRTKLSEFATNHKNDIKRDPEFREQFVSMCESVGVDPLRSSKSIWADVILGIGTYYSDIAVQVLTACMVNRDTYGYLLPLDVCMKAIQGENVSSKDLVRAIRSLDVFGAGAVRILKVGNEQFICSAPDDFGDDGKNLLECFDDESGLTADEISTRLSWSLERTTFCIQSLVKDGTVWIDQNNGCRRYWVFSRYIRSIKGS
jgi:ESCRT-II complex subunit VPS22